MRLRHLGLPVADERRSLAFYATYFGFDPATARRYPDGTVIVRDADGFDLALHPGPVPAERPAFLHFGFAMPDAGRVRALLARLRADGVTVVEHDDEPGYVAFKCLDPDGWRVEVYWEPVEPAEGPAGTGGRP
jgi:catechol 2,3-dioxygenase-like lactoylglutathione lyase family enzyme